MFRKCTDVILTRQYPTPNCTGRDPSLETVQDAGAAYKSCGRLEEQLKRPEVAAAFYHLAAICFQKSDPQGDFFSIASYTGCEIRPWLLLLIAGEYD